MYAAAADVRRRDRAAAGGVAALERRDVDRAAGRAQRRRTVSSGEVVELGKTSPQPPPGAALPARARRARPLPPRLDTPLPVPGAGGRADQPRQLPPPRVGPAIEASGVREAARIYDLRSTFASQRAGGRGDGVRAGADHGHVGADDRAPLRRRCSTAPAPRIAGRLDALDAERRRGERAEDDRAGPKVAQTPRIPPRSAVRSDPADGPISVSPWAIRRLTSSAASAVGAACHAEGRGFESHQPLVTSGPPSGRVRSRQSGLGLRLIWRSSPSCSWPYHDRPRLELPLSTPTGSRLVAAGLVAGASLPAGGITIRRRGAGIA